jgi:FkbM family methyltransferase
MSETLRKFGVYAEVFGWPGYWLALKTRLVPRPYERRVDTPDGPIYLRLKTSDLNAYDKVFLKHDYAFPIDGTPQTIIDAGANIGFASIYFARQFPEAKIIAIEPELSNFKLLERNIRPFKNIIPLQAALWPQDTTLDLVDPGIGHWGFQVRANSADVPRPRIEKVQALSVPTIMHRFGLDQIDIFKIDIEGAEKELFEAPEAWIDKVQTIMIETHDRMKPGCSASFNNATASFGREQKKGENIFKTRVAPGQLTSTAAHGR